MLYTIYCILYTIYCILYTIYYMEKLDELGMATMRIQLLLPGEEVILSFSM